ncbi:putative transcription factor sequence protein [Botrytis fragariae]|uniref:Putative transcription factor sequence protein n=1 Tax=Botrytis fragariae TaxID=1964551 RepID=A0A8H6AI09_9HELO|nr:putative transcription factor sequence protein [Botrytis fragariae]KAF5867982.1 putative transcription factor sequence protein [Botrytis fragariae]
MYRAKFQHPHPGQLNFDEFVAEDVLKIQNNNLTSNLLVSPGTEKAQADWSELMNGNDQAFMDLNITEDDSFSTIFDDVIQIPNAILNTNTNEKQQDVIGWSQNTTANSINSFSNPFTNISESSLNVDDSNLISTPQINNSPKFSTEDAPFDIEVAANSPNTNLATLKPSKKRLLSPLVQPKEPHSLTTDSNSIPSAASLPPKKKRRPRAKKILTPAEILRAREKYLEKNRRAARKCRLKKKAEMTADQERYECCVAEINATKTKLLESRRELLNLIEICKGMVREGCGDVTIKKFVANWERREEAYRGMLESADVGVEAWKLIEKCRSARLGEGALGDAVDLEGEGKGLVCCVNLWEAGNGCEVGNEANIEQVDCDMDPGTTLKFENQSYSASANMGCDESTSFSSLQSSPLVQQTQLYEQQINQQHRPPDLKWHEMITSLQQSYALDPIAAFPNHNENGKFLFQKLLNQINRSRSTPVPMNTLISPLYQEQEQDIVPTEESSVSVPVDSASTSPLNHPAQVQTLPRPLVPHLQRRPNCYITTSGIRQQSFDSGYGSFSSASSSQKNSAPPSQTSDINANCWSPDLAPACIGSVNIVDIQSPLLSDQVTDTCLDFIPESQMGIENGKDLLPLNSTANLVPN